MTYSKPEPTMLLSDAIEELDMDEDELREVIMARSKHVGVQLAGMMNGEEHVFSNVIAAIKQERDEGRYESPDRTDDLDKVEASRDREAVARLGRQGAARERAVTACKGDVHVYKQVFNKALKDLPPDPDPVEPTVDVEAVASEHAVAMVQRTGERHRFSEHYDTKLRELRAVREDAPIQFTRRGRKVYA